MYLRSVACCNNLTLQWCNAKQIPDICDCGSVMGELCAPLFIQQLLSEQLLQSRPLEAGTCDGEPRGRGPVPEGQLTSG